MRAFRDRTIFATVATFGAAFVCACSVIYGNYDDRFQQASTTAVGGDAAGPFFTATGAITSIAAASGSVFVALANQIVRVPEDGGASSVWWTGQDDGGVVKLASNGSDSLLWSFGATTNDTNRLFVSSANSSIDASDIDQGPAFGDFLAMDTASVWSMTSQPMGCKECPVARFAEPGASSPVMLIFDAGRTGSGASSGVGAHAVAVDQSGVDVLFSPGRFARFELDGSPVCTNVGFTPSVAGIVSGADGSPTFILDGTNNASGTLARYETNCPANDTSGVTLANDVSMLIGDDDAVYWSSSTGEIFRAAFTDDAGALLGSAHAPPASLAVSPSYIYAAVGSSVFRFRKTP